MDAYAEFVRSGAAEGCLLRPRRGGSVASLKSAYLKRHGIPARMFNGVRVSLDGKVASVSEQQKLRLGDLQRRISRAEEQIVDAAEHGRLDQVHQKKRRLANLRHRLSALEADIAAGRVRPVLQGRSGCGVSNTISKPTATPAIRKSGSGTGGIRSQRRVLRAGEPG